MKSLLYGIVISAPATAFIIFFALQGRQDVVIQQKAHEVQQQIQSEEFRRDFSEAWHEFDSPASLEEKKLKEEVFEARKAEREDRIARLKKQRESLSGDMDAMFEQLDHDMDDMRSALREAELNSSQSHNF